MHELSDLDQERQAELAGRLIRQQLSLSLKVAAAFILLLIGLPLANLYAPDLMASQVIGFTWTWLFLGVLFFPLTWLLSAYFVKKSDEIEAEETKWQ